MDTSESPCPRTYPMCAKPRTLKYTQRLCNTPSKLTPASALLRLYLSDESHDTGPVMDTDSRGTTTIIEFVQGSVQRIFRSVVQAVNHSASVQGETALITANLLDMKECLEACKADSTHADPKMRLHLDQFLHIVNTSLEMTEMIQKTSGSKLAILHETYQYQLTMCYQLVRSEYEQMSTFSELKTYRFHFDHAVPTASLTAQTSALGTTTNLFPAGSINTGAGTATTTQLPYPVPADETYDEGSYTSTPMDEGVYGHHDSHGDGQLSATAAQAAHTSWLKKQRTRFSRHK